MIIRDVNEHSIIALNFLSRLLVIKGKKSKLFFLLNAAVFLVRNKKTVLFSRHFLSISYTMFCQTGVPNSFFKRLMIDFLDFKDQIIVLNRSI